MHLKIQKAWLVLVILIVLFSACRPAREQTSSISPTEWTPSETYLPTITPPVFLSELTPSFVSVGHSSLGMGVYTWTEPPAERGEPLYAHGKYIRHGLLAHAPSRVDYQLNNEYQVFWTEILLQEQIDCGDGVIFRILLDDVEVFRSYIIYASTEPENIELDVSNASVLSLVTDEIGDNGCDWSIWSDPILIGPGGVAQTYPIPTPRPTPTFFPNSPCALITQDQVYLFLNCNDIRRIRQEIISNPTLRIAWNNLFNGVNNFLSNFPPSFSRVDDPSWIWLDFMPRNIALVYLVTGDPGYANAVIRLLDLVIAGTPVAVPETGRPESGLILSSGHITASYQSLLFSYIAIRDSPFLDDQHRSAYDAFFIQQAQYLDAFSSYRFSAFTEMWNPFLQADASIATIALALPENPHSASLYDRAYQRLQVRIGNWFDRNGGYREYADNYSPLVLRALLLYAETEYQQGNDIYQVDFGGKTLHEICAWYLDVMPPDGMQMSIGDGAWAGELDPGLLRLCAMRTSDPALAFASDRIISFILNPSPWNTASNYLFDAVAWLDASTPVSEPAWTSKLLPDTGLAILRSAWDTQAQYMALNAVDAGLIYQYPHTHSAFGNVILFDDGFWILENGYHLSSVTSPEGYKSSISTHEHSTLTLDNATQTNTISQRTFFSASGNVAMVSIDAMTYPNLRHQRTVLWSSLWHQWLVVDDAWLSPVSLGHSLQLRWYVSENSPGYTLQAEQEVGPEDTSRWTFSRDWGGRGTLTIDLLPGMPARAESIVRQYTEPWWVGGSAKGVEMGVSPSLWPVRLISLLTSNLGDVQAVSGVTRLDSTNATLVSSQRNGQEWTWILTRTPFTNASISLFTLEGQAACLNANTEEILGYCIFAGTNLIYNDRLLVSSSTSASVNVDLAENTISIDTPEQADISFFWPAPITSITEADVSFSFTVDQDIVSVNIPAGLHILEIK